MRGLDPGLEGSVEKGRQGGRQAELRPGHAAVAGVHCPTLSPDQGPSLPTLQRTRCQVKRGIQWLAAPRQEHLRLAGVLLLRQLAEAAPAIFNVHVRSFIEVRPAAGWEGWLLVFWGRACSLPRAGLLQQHVCPPCIGSQCASWAPRLGVQLPDWPSPSFPQVVWNPLRDPRLHVREAAVAALRACLVLVEKRETRYRVQVRGLRTHQLAQWCVEAAVGACVCRYAAAPFLTECHRARPLPAPPTVVLPPV